MSAFPIFITTFKSKTCFNVRSSTYYFHIKTRILPDFQICISVPSKETFFIIEKRLELCSSGYQPPPLPPPLKNTTFLFLAKDPLKLADCLSPPLSRQSPLYIGFSWPTPSKSQIFQWTPNLLKFFILNTILSFKSN